MLVRRIISVRTMFKGFTYMKGVAQVWKLAVSLCGHRDSVERSEQLRQCGDTSLHYEKPAKPEVGERENVNTIAVVFAECVCCRINCCWS